MGTEIESSRQAELFKSYWKGLKAEQTYVVFCAVQGSATQDHSPQCICSHLYQTFYKTKPFSHLYQDDIEPLGTDVMNYRGDTDLQWNFRIAGKVLVLNDNHCVEVQYHWQHYALETTLFQNAQCLLLWNLMVPRHYCITMMPWPTSPLPIKQLLYIPSYVWTTVEYIRAVAFACTVPAGFCFLLPCFKAKAVSGKLIEIEKILV